MKLYKFYKQDCVPCKMLHRVLLDTRFPAGVEFIEVDVTNESNSSLVEKYNVTSVPRLVWEDGRELVGMKTRHVVEEFVNASSI